MTTLHAAHHMGGSFTAAFALVAMWFVMMSAMMAPAVWPWVVAFRRFDMHSARSHRGAATAAFIGGYGLAWLLYSCLAAIVQVILTAQSGFDVMQGLPPAAGGVVLIGAGLVQFTSLTRACLTHCRNPFSYLLSRWRNGPLHAWRIGFGHGLFCVGCCWALMATTLAVGMAHLGWMLAVTAATFVEQVAPRGHLVRVAIGVALIAAGGARVL